MPAEQIILPFPHTTDLSARSYLPLSHHRAALGQLQALQRGQELAGLRLYGPAKVGKSHLLQAWSAVQHWPCLCGDWATIPAELCLSVDAVDTLTLPQQTELFHWFNGAKLSPALLVVTHTDPQFSKLLPDLRSRLLTLPAVELILPTEQDLQHLLRKWAQDHRVQLPENVLNYLVLRTERDPAALQALFQQLDTLALQSGRAITLPLLRDALQSVGEL